MAKEVEAKRGLEHKLLNRCLLIGDHLVSFFHGSTAKYLLDLIITLFGAAPFNKLPFLVGHGKMVVDGICGGGCVPLKRIIDLHRAYGTSSDLTL